MAPLGTPSFSLTDLQDSSFTPNVEKVQFWHEGAYFWFKDKKATKDGYFGKTEPDNHLEVYCFTWNRQTGMHCAFISWISWAMAQG